MSTKQYGLTLALAMIAGMVGGVVSSWFFIGRLMVAQKIPQQAKVLRAERFELVDQSGKVRAVLDTGGRAPTGESITMIESMTGIAPEPALRLYDRDGNVRGVFGLWLDEDPVLEYRGKDGKSRVRLASTPDQASFLQLSDKAGMTLIELDIDFKGDPSLLLRGKNSSPLASFGVTDGKAHLYLWPKDAYRPTAGFSFKSDGSLVLDF